jgi:hypothetical protein
MGGTAERGRERRSLRNFGLTVGIAFGVLAGLLFWRGRSHYIYFVPVSAFFLLMGLIVPGLLKPIRRGWMTAAAAMGWVMTRVILTVLFFAVFTPLGFIARLVGKRFLHLAIETSAESYWVPKDPEAAKSEALERQF